MILVTGGCGFIGSNFILYWLGHSGESVVNIDKLTYASGGRNLELLERDDRYHFVKTGIEDFSVVLDLLKSHKPRAIINFAAESHVDRSILGPEQFVQTNVLGTLRLLEAARVYWSELPAVDKAAFRFLHVSTDEVYGTLEHDEPPFTEFSPYKPNSPYAASKAASDHLVRAWHQTYGLPVLITNCSNNYGPFQFPEKLIPLVIHNAISGERIPIYGDGQQVRDWLHVIDHCRAITRVLEAGTPGEIYNVGGGNQVANIEVVRLICDLLDTLRPRRDGRSHATGIVFVKDRPGHDRRYAIDATKMKRELGWEPLESFDTGIRKTVEWYLNNPEWLQRVTGLTYRQWVNDQYAIDSKG